MATHATMKKLTPVLFVDEIEPCLGFWTKLGFEKTVEVPEGEKLGFVILVKDGVEVMYQSRASALKDVPALADMPSRAALYLEVSDLDAVAQAVAGAPVVVPRRKTFYGAEEIGVREPGGSVVTFAVQQAG
ncbi:MAG TPA: VOC family protein [Myxococcales bacterium]|nr:VOC family protein [Myxococcales bacterium]